MAETSDIVDTAVTLGHLRLRVTDLDGAVAFFTAIGGRKDTEREGFCVVEFRDRTRLQLFEVDAVEPGQVPQWDFRVPDIDAMWAECRDRGLEPSEITRRNPGHDWFQLSGPDGCEIRINSAFTRRK